MEKCLRFIGLALILSHFGIQNPPLFRTCMFRLRSLDSILALCFLITLPVTVFWKNYRITQVQCRQAWLI